MIFNETINFAILQFDDIVRDSESAMRTAWTAFRDLANIGLVFTLLYISVRTILRTGGHDTKKMLAGVIIAALLVNFSYFFGALVVDIANSLAVELHSELNNGESVVDRITIEANAITLINEISENAVMENVIGLEGAAALEAATRTLASSVMNIIIVVVYILVLVVAIAMLLGRIISLIFLLVVSPIGVAAAVLPNTVKISKEWWQSLFGQAFFVPAFLLFLVLALEVAEAIDLVVENDDGVDGTAIAAGAVSEVMNSLIVLALIVGALMIAQRISNAGGTAVGKLSGQISTKIGGAALGASAFAGRNTAGLVSNRLLNSDKVQDSWSKNRVGRAGLRALDYGAKANYDLRGAKSFKGVASATGVGDFGKPKQGGFAGGVEKRQKAKENFSKNVLRDVSDKDPRVAAIKKRKESAEEILKSAKRVGNEEMQKKAAKQVEKYSEELSTEKNRRRREYGEQLERRGGGKAPITGIENLQATLRQATTGLGQGNSASAGAGANILKELDKTKSDKQIKQIVDALKDQTSNDSRLGALEAKRDADAAKKST